MSERTPRITPELQTEEQKLDLSVLSAHSRPAPTVSEPKEGSTCDTDLSKLSIATADVPRIGSVIERRRDLDHALNKQDRTARHMTSRPRIDRTRHGILRNPYFRYRGGPLLRLITLFANLLKFLEQLLVGKVGRARIPPQQQVKARPSPEPPHHDQKIAVEKGRKDERLRLKSRIRRIHRS